SDPDAPSRTGRLHVQGRPNGSKRRRPLENAAVVADGSGMGTTVGASSERVAVEGHSLWWARLRRIASAVLAMIAVVLAGSDAVAAATPAGQDVSWPQCS